MEGALQVFELSLHGLEVQKHGRRRAQHLEVVQTSIKRLHCAAFTEELSLGHRQAALPAATVVVVSSLAVVIDIPLAPALLEALLAVELGVGLAGSDARVERDRHDG